MKRFLILSVMLCVCLIGQAPQAHADSYYRINLRAYRRMMHFQGPHPLADRFWGVVDNQLLQTGGPLEQLIKALLAKNLTPANNQTDANGALVAQRAVVQDQDLLSADAKVRQMCNKLNIPFVQIAQTPTGTTTPAPNPQTPTNRDPNLALPAPAPPVFTLPGQVPKK